MSKHVALYVAYILYYMMVCCVKLDAPVVTVVYHTYVPHLRQPKCYSSFLHAFSTTLHCIVQRFPMQLLQLKLSQSKAENSKGLNQHIVLEYKI